MIRRIAQATLPVAERLLGSAEYSNQNRLKRTGPSGPDFRIFGQASKGMRWMPWHQEAMKDVVTCDKPRLAGNKLTRGSPNGETPPGKPRRSLAEYIGQGGQPGELKHLSTPRKGKQTATSLVAASEREIAQTVRMPRPYPLCARGRGTYLRGHTGPRGGYKSVS